MEDEIGRKLNDLARHQAITRLYNDILFDLHVCEIEGWDKMEYLDQIRELVNTLGKEESK